MKTILFVSDKVELFRIEIPSIQDIIDLLFFRFDDEIMSELIYNPALAVL